MKPVIIADHREREVIRYLGAEACTVEKRQLAVGDYILSDRVGAERKRVSDFLQSIVDRRMFAQLEQLSKTFTCPVMILEGNPELLYLERNIHENVIRGVFSSIAIDYRIPIIWTQNTQETAKQLFWIANREQVLEKHSPQIRGSRKSRSVQEEQEYLVAGLPGINTKRARKLLEYFKTPERVFRASEKQLLKVDGFGEKMSKRMKSLLKEPYK